MSRILVLGGGLIGRRHVERILAHPKAELVGLVDPNPSAAADLNVPRFASMQDVDADAALIATPSSLHADQAIEAAQLGMAILIEKPVATTLEQSDQMMDAISTPALVGHHRRHHARVQMLNDVLDEGAIGQVLTVSMIWAMRKPDDYFAGNWRSAGGSPVMINLVHDLDLLRFWFGDIEQIAAFPGPRLRGSERIETGSVLMTMANGATATINFADTAPSPWGFEAGTGENPNIGTTRQDMMWITGSEGAISFPSLTLWHGTDWSTPAQSEARLQERDEQAPLDAQLDHFLDVIDGKAAPICTLRDGRAALAAALEIETQLTAHTQPSMRAAQ